MWAAVTTVTSCGAVNAAMESLTGIGGLVPMVDLGYGESVFGGVGTGLYTMLLYVLLAVFIGGLMVGRTPEFLGKKVEAREIKLVSLGVLVTPLAVLLATGAGAGAPSTARRRSSPPGRRASASRCTPTCRRPTTTARRSPATPATTSPTPATSAPTASPSPTCSAGVTMLGARFAPILLVLAVAGALAGKRVAPLGAGTLRTDTPTFVALLGGVVVLIGALTFFPALLLGPVVQGMTDRLF